jgi:Mg/Co/Ni transporter MgtE
MFVLSREGKNEKRAQEALAMAAPELKTYFQTFTTDSLGQIFMTGILTVEAFDKVNLEIVQFPHAAVSMTVVCDMGKISGTTLAQTVGQFSLGTAGQIHTFDVIGPEFSVVLTGGPANTDVPIQAWVFLH